MAVLLVWTVSGCKEQPAGEPNEPADTKQSAQDVQSSDDEKSGDGGMIEIQPDLPDACFQDTPENLNVPNLKKQRPEGEERPPLLAPAGTTNVALGKPVTSSDSLPIIGSVDLIVDGDKQAQDGHYVELAPFLQYVTIDLKNRHNVYGIYVWHYHKAARYYKDVIVQTADDPNFTTNVNTIFNNDIDNSAELGVGKDKHYIDTNEGKLIDARGVQGRYVRLYSNGSNSSAMNHYIEVEVYGKPVE